MGLRELIAACTLLFMCSADQNFSTVNSMLDPSRLTWWRSKWAPAPIILSANNAGQTVSATFYLCPSTSITSGVVEITFPTSFTITSATGQTVNGLIVTVSKTLTAGTDDTVIVSNIVNPTQAGVYGPFSIRTRQSAGGQQIDVNLTFGSVCITPAVTAISGATVSVVGAPTTGIVINTPGNTLSFKFTISQSLWRYDTFVISLDNKWTVNSGATCSSMDYSGKVNNFNGTNSASPHSLQCSITQKSTTVSSQTAYIYGLAVDGIDTTVNDNKYVDLRITSVVAPEAAFSGNPYTWTVTTYRFGTYTMLEQATLTSGPSVTTDVISSVTWGPTWTSAVSDQAYGLSYFMDMSITLKSKISGLAAMSKSRFQKN